MSVLSRRVMYGDVCIKSILSGKITNKSLLVQVTYALVHTQTNKINANRRRKWMQKKNNKFTLTHSRIHTVKHTSSNMEISLHLSSHHNREQHFFCCCFEIHNKCLKHVMRVQRLSLMRLVRSVFICFRHFHSFRTNAQAVQNEHRSLQETYSIQGKIMRIVLMSYVTWHGILRIFLNWFWFLKNWQPSRSNTRAYRECGYEICTERVLFVFHRLSS